MTTEFGFIDYLVFTAYAVLILGVGLWVSREKDGHQKNAEDYFLASKSLPWWAIGSSLIAANISAEQFIGMQLRFCIRISYCLLRVDGRLHANYCREIFFTHIY